jgi:hypothetical protein
MSNWLTQLLAGMSPEDRTQVLNASAPSEGGAPSEEAPAVAPIATSAATVEQVQAQIDARIEAAAQEKAQQIIAAQEAQAQQEARVQTASNFASTFVQAGAITPAEAEAVAAVHAAIAELSASGHRFKSEAGDSSLIEVFERHFNAKTAVVPASAPTQEEGSANASGTPGSGLDLSKPYAFLMQNAAASGTVLPNRTNSEDAKGAAENNVASYLAAVANGKEQLDPARLQELAAQFGS